ncbi:MAG: asparagine synthase (glutamine-hydrolyzing) [Chloroflexales bacterium]
MCGIAGLVCPDRSAAEMQHTVQRMTDVLFHRGPDDDGFFVAEGVGLGMRRLSIIDVAGGRQPIANEDGTIQVVFNGEIYNYPQLRTDLESRGHIFRTRSDTEVIAHLYEERGAGCLSELRGMFGIAVWDQRNRRLMLARDRLGKKPLFYACRGDQLFFGSEIKSLLAADPTLAEPDPAAVIPYFQYGFIPEPGTMFRHIHKLPAAHWLTYEQGSISTAPYWQLTFSPQEHSSHRSSAEWVAELDALLEESVRIRLMSEVPLGVFLSGGLDSSAIVAYAHKAGLRPLKTFTIGFDRPEWNESADAQIVADHFQTEHHTLILREEDLARNLPETVLTLVRHFDEPFGDSSALPTYHVSRLARQHVTVVLSGDGGDELFAGYTRYQGIRFAEHYRQLPYAMQRILPFVAHVGATWFPAGRRYGALRAERVMHDSMLPFSQMYFNKVALCSQGMLQRLMPNLSVEGQSPLSMCMPAIAEVMRSNMSSLSKASYIDIHFRLLEDMLVKVDRMSMAHGLEVRSPLLDHRLVELVARMPDSLKLRGWQTKAVLRDTIRPYLPPATMRKRKQGFSIPLRSWLRTDLYSMVQDYLGSAGSGLERSLFDHSFISNLLVQHRKGEADHSEIIWLLLNYAAWYDLYVTQKGV